MDTLIQPTLFDYAGLDAETRIVVQQRTTEIKGLMKRAAQDIIDIGQKLIEVKARLGHGQFGAWLVAEFDWDGRTARRFMDVAQSFKTDNLSNLKIAPSALYLLAAPSTPDDLRAEFITAAQDGQAVTHGMVRGALAEQRQQPPVGQYAAAEHHAQPLPFEPSPSAYDNAAPPLWETYQGWDDSDDEPPAAVAPDPEILPADDYDGDEWYTPDPWLDAARLLFDGQIDLDPASCAAAQQRVQAAAYYTKDDNGLELPWRGNVWCNPPYSTKLVQAFTARAHDQYAAGNASAVLLLVNNCTDARWFSTLAQRYPVVFSYGRADFWRPDQTSFATRQGQALFYLGPNVQRFYDTFSALAYAPNWRLR